MFKQHESIKVKILESSSIPIGDGIMTVGIVTYDLKPKSGPDMQNVEVWTDLTHKIDGRWVYVFDQATVLSPELRRKKIKTITLVLTLIFVSAVKEVRTSTLYYLAKIDKTGNVYEYVDSTHDFPSEIDPNHGFYSIHYRQ